MPHNPTLLHFYRKTIIPILIIPESSTRYWLPSLLKHTNIALRFLPQDAYEKAAPLDVTPKPISVTRIFMLWKGVLPEEKDNWDIAIKRTGQMSVGEWREIVGLSHFCGERDSVNIDGLKVLEWGGMEVKV